MVNPIDGIQFENLGVDYFVWVVAQGTGAEARLHFSLTLYLFQKFATKKCIVTLFLLILQPENPLSTQCLSVFFIYYGESSY